MTRVQFEGVTLDARTRDMVIAARVICDAPLYITQGCYNAGGVAASAGTHDGGGAVDIRARDLTDAQIAEAVLDLRHVGFAAWHRTPDQGNWVEHIHCIAIGCPDLSAGAADQVVAYKDGRNGLRNNRADDGPRTYVDWTWEKYKQAFPNLLTETPKDEVDMATIAELKTAFLDVLTEYNGRLYGAKGTEGVWNKAIQDALKAQAAADQAQYNSTVAEVRATQQIALDAIQKAHTDEMAALQAAHAEELAAIKALLPKA